MDVQSAIREKHCTVIRGANTPGICKCGEKYKGGREVGDEGTRKNEFWRKIRGIRKESLERKSMY